MIAPLKPFLTASFLVTFFNVEHACQLMLERQLLLLYCCFSFLLLTGAYKNWKLELEHYQSLYYLSPWARALT